MYDVINWYTSAATAAGVKAKKLVRWLQRKAWELFFFYTYPYSLATTCYCPGVKKQRVFNFVAMQQRYAWLILLLAILYGLYTNYEHRNIVKKLITGDFNFWLEKETINNEKLFTQSELENYNSLENGLYLSIVGNVFDVTTGEKHYGPGSTYHAFTGRDASLAFLTGEFTEEALTDDLSSLTNSQSKAVNTWIAFYNENYIYKGKLIGRYYDENGKPTKHYEIFEAKVKQAEEDQSKEDEKKRMFPPCNVEWKADVGTRFWCTKQSGGVSRDWEGVPRQYFERPGTEHSRCTCVNLDSKVYKDNQGSFREYEECLEHSTTCTVLAKD